jgi:hypothetical protein
MDTEEYLVRSRLFRRLKIGSHGQLVERYAARLVEDGLARQGTWRCLSLIGDLLSWMTSSRFDLANLDERTIECSSGAERGSSPSSRATGRR